MKRKLADIITSIAIIGVIWSFALRPSFPQSAEDQAVKRAYEAYVQAWKTKDIPALQRVLSDDYMAINFEGKLSDKANEIATAKSDADWHSMTVDEIHTKIFADTAIASGFISAEGTRPDGNTFNAKVRFLATLVKHNNTWQLVATQSASFKPAQ